MSMRRDQSITLSGTLVQKIVDHRIARDNHPTHAPTAEPCSECLALGLAAVPVFQGLLEAALDQVVP